MERADDDDMDLEYVVVAGPTVEAEAGPLVPNPPLLRPLVPTPPLALPVTERPARPKLLTAVLPLPPRGGSREAVPGAFPDTTDRPDTLKGVAMLHSNGTMQCARCVAAKSAVFSFVI